MPADIEIKDVVLLLAGIGAGLAGGYGISHHFYKKQEESSDKFGQNIYYLLDRNYQQSLKIGINDSRIIEEIRSAESKVKSISDLVEIKARMDQILNAIEGLANQEAIPAALVFEHKALGDRWSHIASIQLDLKIMSFNGRIEIDRFKAAHENIFPSDYPWAGDFRKENVIIVDTIGTVTRIVDLTSVQTKLETVAPDKVEKNIRELFESWNQRVAKLLEERSEIKIAEISTFHHELELIHPFLDGNGRIGRILVEEQIAYTFGVPIKFRPDREDYYRALRALDYGAKELFEKLIRQTLNDFNVDL